jgi:dTDP-4-amino-4,6-dideoxygalactose transaminase
MAKPPKDALPEPTALINLSITKASVAKSVANPKSAPANLEPVPMLDLKRQYAQIQDEVLPALARVCQSQWFVGGPELQAFEKEAAEQLSVKRAVGCASGTDALWLALLAAGIGPGDNVITTPFSFFATASSILRAGARPVFVDIDPETLNISPEKIEQRLRYTPARAAMPVHLYGQCADWDGLSRIAEDYKIVMVEDAAQAYGASWRGKRAGALGTTAAFSFYPTKNLSAFGDAGMVTTHHDDMADHVRWLRDHGSKQRYYHDEVGWNSRLDAVQAAVLRIKMKHIARWNLERRERAAIYDRMLEDAGLLASTDSGSPNPLQSLKTHSEAFHIYHQYVVRARERDALRKFLTDRQIGSEIYYPVPLHLQKCFVSLGYREGDLPEAERAATEVLALPMFPELTHEEQHRVVESIADFYS